MKRRQLTIFPSLPVSRLPDGRVSITRKLISGLQAYVQRWDADIVVPMQSGPLGSNLDNEAVDPRQLPFRLVVDGDVRAEIAQSAVVLATATADQTHLAPICRELQVPFAYVSEYSLRTRLQMVRAETRNPLLLLRRTLWHVQQERRLRRAISLADGVQCNGTPTYDAYRDLTPNPLLFFDTRSADDALIGADELATRLAGLMRHEPLRLAFSGRLVRIKGADHLIDVAQHLDRLGVAFHMTICGDGELSDSMRARIGSLPVVMAGVLDFERELQPLLKRSIDLFVCCHRQGDPSCTYLETMSTGVPIVSYDNEAFVGVRAAAGTGWSVPMDRPDLMAAQIARLSRAEIAEASHQSLGFAKLHTFEKVFDQRIEHLRRLSQAAWQVPRSGTHEAAA